MMTFVVLLLEKVKKKKPLIRSSLSSSFPILVHVVPELKTSPQFMR